jgi:hypothetical protein
MLEWVCPKCSRDVDPGLTRCPFCGYEEARAAAAAVAAPAVNPMAQTVVAPARPGQPVRRMVRRARPKKDWSGFWADVDRGFRFGLGFVAALAVTYFILYLIAYYGGYGEWAERLARWLRLR